MKILCAPDLHCWWTTYERDIRAQTPSRLLEWKQAADEMCDFIKEQNVSCALFPGDLFIESRPSPAAVVEVVDLFTRLERMGVRVIAIMGNHDFAGLDQKNFVDVLGEYNRDWGVTSPQVIMLDKDVSVVCLPFKKYVGDMNKASQDLIETSLSLRSQVVTPRSILLAHWGTDFSRYANGYIDGAPRDPTLSLSDLISSGFDACVLGHIHRAQILCNNPPIFHTGILTRGKCDEGNIDCSCFVLDTDGILAQKYLRTPRKIIKVEFSEETMENFKTGDWLAEVPNVRDALVTVSYTISEDKLRGISHRDILHALYAAGAYYVEGIHPVVVKQQRQRSISITERTSELDSFKAWYQTTGEPEELLSESVDLFTEYLRKAKGQ